MLNRTDKRDSISILELQGQAFDGEIQYCVEFPKAFDGEVVFLNFSQDSTLNSFYRNDAASIEFLSGILSQTPPIPPRGLPKDVSEETRNEVDTCEDELIQTPSYLTDADVKLLLKHYDVSPDCFNPVVEASRSVLQILTTRYGEFLIRML